MKRTIKFRAWDKKNKAWVFSDHLPGLAWFFDLIEKGDYELMQFIGLKDKNGKEIYEGDIIQCEQLILTVEWSDFYACFAFMQDNRKSIDVGNASMYEIIGNIYENENLLEGGDEKWEK